ncbi:hypothetical protein B0H19DRAFT_1190822 [Mycena capillaripes]|nr:hypothetical protein B0H19DRAFT_1190822 [Mycena capillaripes]
MRPEPAVEPALDYAPQISYPQNWTQQSPTFLPFPRNKRRSPIISELLLVPPGSIPAFGTPALKYGPIEGGEVLLHEPYTHTNAAPVAASTVPVPQQYYSSSGYYTPQEMPFTAPFPQMNVAPLPAHQYRYHPPSATYPVPVTESLATGEKPGIVSSFQTNMALHYPPSATTLSAELPVLAPLTEMSLAPSPPSTVPSPQFPQATADEAFFPPHTAYLASPQPGESLLDFLYADLEPPAEAAIMLETSGFDGNYDSAFDAYIDFSAGAN